MTSLDPNAPRCTGPQCDEAVQYTIAGFGPFFTDQEQRQLKRLFLDFSPKEVQAAVDQLIKQGASRPRPKDFGSVLEANRRFLRSQNEVAKDPTWKDVPKAEEGVPATVREALDQGIADNQRRHAVRLSRGATT